MHQYKKLKVWQKSMSLSLMVYDITKDFPKEEKYGLTQQIRRSAVSVPSNIAEGAGRISVKEFKYFLRVSYGSICELDTQLMIASKLGFINKEDYYLLIKQLNEIQKMTYSLSNSKSINM